MTRPLILLLLFLPLAGCASLMSSATGQLASDLSAAILDQNDPETVEAGAPAYLLLVDGLIRDDPKGENLLLAGARLYDAYAGVFVRDEARARRLTEKSRDYAERALCRHRDTLCGISRQPFDDFRSAVGRLGKEDVAALYAYAAAWAGWIQAHSDDWTAVADLARVRAAMQRVVALDEGYDHGGAHLYLGVMETLLPPGLGGKPEEGRKHFERALALSQGKNLMVKVEYARRYARLTFNRDLHDRLLKEVLEAQTISPGLTLSNTLAQRQAQELLKSANNYF
jgi:hypothetical protein